MANYEAYRAMYEGREAKLFTGSTGGADLDEQPRPTQHHLADLQL